MDIPWECTSLFTKYFFTWEASHACFLFFSSFFSPFFFGQKLCSSVLYMDKGNRHLK